MERRSALKYLGSTVTLRRLRGFLYRHYSLLPKILWFSHFVHSRTAVVVTGQRASLVIIHHGLLGRSSPLAYGMGLRATASFRTNCFSRCEKDEGRMSINGKIKAYTTLCRLPAVILATRESIFYIDLVYIFLISFIYIFIFYFYFTILPMKLVALTLVYAAVFFFVFFFSFGFCLPDCVGNKEHKSESIYRTDYQSLIKKAPFRMAYRV